jgi:UDP-glucose 4-epimerase
MVDPELKQSKEWRQIMSFYRWLKPGLLAMRLPWIGPRLQRSWIKPGSDANWFIPAHRTIQVGEAISMGEQVPLPYAVVERLLNEAESIFAMKACPCRTAFHCQEHSQELGCLHLGPAAWRIPPGLGRLVSVDEGREHLALAMRSGLIPTILHIPSEAEIFQVDKNRLLSVCFCCECCCDVRLMLRRGPELYWDLYNQRMPGLIVSVSDACTLCGACVQACYGGERVIRMGEQRAEIGARCLGCGKCLAACPEAAISFEVDPQADLIQSLLNRITERVQITGGEKPHAEDTNG